MANVLSEQKRRQVEDPIDRELRNPCDGGGSVAMTMNGTSAVKQETRPGSREALRLLPSAHHRSPGPSAPAR